MMPGCLADLPDPDKVFLGGGLAGKSDILPEILDRLRPGGRIVAHCALLGSLNKVKQCLESMGWSLSVTLVQAAQSGELAGDLHMEAVNPIFRCCGGQAGQETAEAVADRPGASAVLKREEPWEESWPAMRE